MHTRENRIGVGIIGAGFGANVQLPAFLSQANARVIGIVGNDPEKSNMLAAEHHLEQSFEGWRELIACPAIDLVSIAVPPAAQAEIARAAIDANKHVLCEKPFTVNATTARELFDAAKKAGIVHAIDFEFRELPALQELHGSLGLIGDIQHAELRWRVGTWADPKRTWSWQCDRSQGGGILTALGVHLFDALQWLFGPVDRMKSEIQITFPQRSDATGIVRAVTSEDTAHIELQMHAGFRAHVIVTNTAPDPEGLTIVVKGAAGTLHVRSKSTDYGGGLTLTLEKAGGKTETLLTDGDPPKDIDARIPLFQRFSHRLLRAVETRDTAFQPNFQTGLDIQILQDAALASASQGQWLVVA